MNLTNKMSATTNGKRSSNQRNKYTTTINLLQGQNKEILLHMIKNGSITTMEAFCEYGITRLSARIYDLRHRYDIPIISENITKGNTTYAKYSIKEEDDV